MVRANSGGGRGRVRPDRGADPAGPSPLLVDGLHLDDVADREDRGLAVLDELEERPGEVALADVEVVAKIVETGRAAAERLADVVGPGESDTGHTEPSGSRQ